jgi:DNA polymerase I-like protein with 3'-5' exonuclease and polymerase domains
MKSLVFDIETDGLQSTKIYCMSVLNTETEEQFNFPPSKIEEGVQLLESADKLIGHNIIGFDIPEIKRLHGVNLMSKKIIDTLVLSRLFNPIRASHGLKAWGDTLNFPKMEFDNYTRYSDDMMKYCAQDVLLNYKVYQALKSESKGFTSESVNLETETYKITCNQRDFGFFMNQEAAQDLLTYFKEELIKAEEEVHKTFKPKVIERPLKAQHTEQGVLKKLGIDKEGKQARLTSEEYDAMTKGANVVTRITEEPFNLGSRQQIGQYLQEFGWEPQEFTPTGQPKIDETILSKVKDIPEAAIIARYLMLQKRIAQVQSWLSFLRRDRVHGSVISNGTITGRMSHRDPNLAQVPSISSPYGKECRAVWSVPRGYKLVGVDASGLELRMLAHYLNDKEFIDDILNGDIHTANQRRAGLQSRNQAKTFIYAFLYGAGDAKIGSILGGGKREGKRVKQSFLNNFPTLKSLRNRITREAEQNEFIKGLDGRKIFIRSSHAALNSLLQGAGAIVMKRGLIILNDALQDSDVDAHVVANVHDEWQLETWHEDVDRLGDMAVNAIRQAGDYYKLNCPLDAEYKVGENWSETH